MGGARIRALKKKAAKPHTEARLKHIEEANAAIQAHDDTEAGNRWKKATASVKSMNRFNFAAKSLLDDISHAPVHLELNFTQASINQLVFFARGSRRGVSAGVFFWITYFGHPTCSGPAGEKCTFAGYCAFHAEYDGQAPC